MAEWSKAVDCKSARETSRWFEPNFFQKTMVSNPTSVNLVFFNKISQHTTLASLRKYSSVRKVRYFIPSLVFTELKLLKTGFRGAKNMSSFKARLRLLSFKSGVSAVRKPKIFVVLSWRKRVGLVKLRICTLKKQRTHPPLLLSTATVPTFLKKRRSFRWSRAALFVILTALRRLLLSLGAQNYQITAVFKSQFPHIPSAISKLLSGTGSRFLNPFTKLIYVDKNFVGRVTGRDYSLSFAEIRFLGYTPYNKTSRTNKSLRRLKRKVQRKVFS